MKDGRVSINAMQLLALRDAVKLKAARLPKMPASAKTREAAMALSKVRSEMRAGPAERAALRIGELAEKTADLAGAMRADMELGRGDLDSAAKHLSMAFALAVEAEGGRKALVHNPLDAESSSILVAADGVAEVFGPSGAPSGLRMAPGAALSEWARIQEELAAEAAWRVNSGRASTAEAFGDGGKEAQAKQDEKAKAAAEKLGLPDGGAGGSRALTAARALAREFLDRSFGEARKELAASAELLMSIEGEGNEGSKLRIGERIKEIEASAKETPIALTKKMLHTQLAFFNDKFLAGDARQLGAELTATLTPANDALKAYLAEPTQAKLKKLEAERGRLDERLNDDRIVARIVENLIANKVKPEVANSPVHNYLKLVGTFVEEASKAAAEIEAAALRVEAKPGVANWRAELAELAAAEGSWASEILRTGARRAAGFMAAEGLARADELASGTLSLAEHEKLCAGARRIWEGSLWGFGGNAAADKAEALAILGAGGCKDSDLAKLFDTAEGQAFAKALGVGPGSGSPAGKALATLGMVDWAKNEASALRGIANPGEAAAKAGAACAAALAEEFGAKESELGAKLGKKLWGKRVASAGGGASELSKLSAFASRLSEEVPAAAAKALAGFACGERPKAGASLMEAAAKAAEEVGLTFKGAAPAGPKAAFAEAEAAGAVVGGEFEKELAGHAWMAGVEPTIPEDAPATTRANGWLRAANEWATESLGLNKAALAKAKESAAVGEAVLRMAWDEAQRAVARRAKEAEESKEAAAGKLAAKFLNAALAAGRDPETAVKAGEWLANTKSERFALGSYGKSGKELAEWVGSELREGAELGRTLSRLAAEEASARKAAGKWTLAVLDGVAESLAKEESEKAAKKAFARSAELFDDYGNAAHSRLFQELPSNFSWNSLMRAQKGWHEAMIGKAASLSIPDWTPLAGELAGGAWRAVELASAASLAEEGNAMSHCAGGYVDQCRRGDSVIFSIRKDGVRECTLELRKDRDGKWKTVQNRSRFNGEPSPEAVRFCEKVEAAANNPELLAGAVGAPEERLGALKIDERDYAGAAECAALGEKKPRSRAK